MEPITQADAEQLQRDLTAAHDALRNIYVILAAIESSKPDTVFYEIGRAQGTASTGLAMSGGKR